jgi:rfaE bifunctional protein nucleotidyltransferase chain/domain
MNALADLHELVRLRPEWKRQGKKIVFTNGCFDIIHYGHVDYLTRAKALGDILIVALNSDASVRRLKGPLRPIVSQEGRAAVMASLKPVDYVIVFEEDTPYETIKAIVPDILVKGGDWSTDTIVGKDVVEQAGGSVHSLEFLAGYSTTSMIQKILETAAPSSIKH